MKKIILISLLFIFSNLIIAQSFTFRPSASLIEEAPLNTYLAFKIDMVKQSTSPMTLKWIKLENTFPAGWDFNLCDHGGCYTGIPDSGTMIPLYDTTSGFLKINLNPRSILTTGIARFYVWDIKHPDQGMETVFEITSTEVTSLQETLSKETFSFYPNPATDYISVNFNSINSGKLEIIGLTGQKAIEMWIEPKLFIKIDISNLPRGIYFVKFNEMSGKIITKKLIVK